MPATSQLPSRREATKSALDATWPRPAAMTELACCWSARNGPWATAESREKTKAREAQTMCGSRLRERGAFAAEQSAFGGRRLLLEGAIEERAGLVEVAERGVELGVGGEGVRVAGDEIALRDRVE